jgi:hypothetical protein
MRPKKAEVLRNHAARHTKHVSDGKRQTEPLVRELLAASLAGSDEAETQLLTRFQLRKRKWAVLSGTVLFNPHEPDGDCYRVLGYFDTLQDAQESVANGNNHLQSVYGKLRIVHAGNLSALPDYVRTTIQHWTVVDGCFEKR